MLKHFSNFSYQRLMYCGLRPCVWRSGDGIGSRSPAGVVRRGIRFCCCCRCHCCFPWIRQRSTDTRHKTLHRGNSFFATNGLGQLLHSAVRLGLNFLTVPANGAREGVCRVLVVGISLIILAILLLHELLETVIGTVGLFFLRGLFLRTLLLDFSFLDFLLLPFFLIGLACTLNRGPLSCCCCVLQFLLLQGTLLRLLSLSLLRCSVCKFLI
mmetsp:Transcript_82022/g.158469  ORF Transcript_82022/g.158469 Transcript_82022/m.158469 type:complete len:212 (+) Transcript_82022:278-913(+)